MLIVCIYEWYDENCCYINDDIQGWSEPSAFALSLFFFFFFFNHNLHLLFFTYANHNCHLIFQYL